MRNTKTTLIYLRHLTFTRSRNKEKCEFETTEEKEIKSDEAQTGQCSAKYLFNRRIKIDYYVLINTLNKGELFI